MKNLNRILLWLVYNVGALTLVWFGAVKNHQGALVMLCIYTAYNLLCSVFATSHKPTLDSLRAKERFSPLYVNVLITCVAVPALVATNHPWIAAGWLLVSSFQWHIFKPTNEQTQTTTNNPPVL